MRFRLKTFLFVFILLAGILSGAPISGMDSNTRANVCPMKCCKKKSLGKAAETNKDSKYLCGVMVCSQTSTTNLPQSTSITVAPAIVTSEKETMQSILFSTSPKEIASFIKPDAPHISPSLSVFIKHQRILV